jgi:hypothetical protein
MTQNSNNGSDSPKSISKVVGQHADRVMDGLFSEIEELLSGDLQEQQPPQLNAATKAPHNLEPNRQPVPQGLSQPAAPARGPNASPGAALPPAQPATPPVASQAPATRRWPKWLAVGGGLAVCLGGGLWWLQSQGKIDLTALGRGESPIVLSNSGDVKFSEYLRNSLTKIDSNNPVASTGGTQVSIPNPPTAATGAAPVATGSPAPAIEATLVKIVPGNPPIVEFMIGGQVQQFKGGDQVANSGWIVTNVINTVDNEVILKRNGESRSLKLNDKL